MTNETESSRRGSFVTSVWPWLVGAAMLGVYLSTLYHSATPASLNRLADLSGWNWRPKMFAPVTFLATYPLHWLPPGLTAVGMNVFNAVCAALVLVLLARSVALLPHDRTNEERQREQSETSILTIRSAWLPPLFAALVCGLQLTFWENAVEFRQLTIMDGGEMLNLLLFAYAVRCLLEYRLSQRGSWLSRFALVLGLGMANDWFMVALFPAFIVALVWVKGFEFFDWRFLLRTVLWGLAGLLFILVFPLIHGFSITPFGTIFKYSLHYILGGDGMTVGYKTELHALLQVRGLLLLLALSSVLPVLLMGIRWSSSFGDNTPLGIFLATCAFNLSHAFLLLYCLWNALDGPFGPRQRIPGGPFLPLYFLGALSIGYFSGYFLLVFGARPAKPRQRPNPLVVWLSRGVTGAVWLLAIAVPLAMISRNTQSLSKNRTLTDAMQRCFARAEQSLPRQGGVVLSDDPFWLQELRSVLVRDGNKADYLMVETSSLSQAWTYVEFLTRTHPQFGLSAALADMPTGRPLAADDCIHLVERLGTNHPVYYLHPSYGYYFERFYPRSHGLVYELQFCPTNVWTIPASTPEELAENRAFWQGAGPDLTFLLHAMEPPPRNDNPNLWQRFQQSAGLATEMNGFAGLIGRYYSRALNNWGVKQAIAGFPEDAGKSYALAKQLNPGNASAIINVKFNQEQLEGRKPVLKQPKAFEAEMGGDYRQWFQVINGGPVDEPSFCGAMGLVAYLPGNNYRQAIHELERERDLMPGDLTPLLQLSQACLYIQVHPNALEYAYPPPAQTGSNALAFAEEAVRLAPTNLGALSCKTGAQLQLGLYEQAIPALDSLLTLQPTNHLVRYYRGIAEIKLGKLDAAKKDLEKVIEALPEFYQIYFTLGDIAYNQKDNAAAAKYYELYLAKAPASMTNSPQVAPVFKRLDEIRTNK